MMQSRNQLAELATALGGIPVWGCLPGSQAQRAGVRYGDVILTVNGVPTANVEEYVSARALDEDAIALVVFREGRELTLSVPLSATAAPVGHEALERAAAQLGAARLLPGEPGELRGGGGLPS